MNLDVNIFERAITTKSSEAINAAANDIIAQLELDLVFTEGYEQLVYDYISLHACAYGKAGHAMKNKSMSENLRSTYEQVRNQIENVKDFQKANDLMRAMYGCSVTGTFQRIVNNTYIDGSVPVTTTDATATYTVNPSLTEAENAIINQLAATNPETTKSNKAWLLLLLLAIAAMVAYFIYKRRGK